MSDGSDDEATIAPASRMRLTAERRAAVVAEIDRVRSRLDDRGEIVSRTSELSYDSARDEIALALLSMA